MSSILWAGAAISVGVVVLWGVAMAVMPAVPGSAGGPLPATALQRASRWSLGIALVPALASVVVVGVFGPGRLASESALRLGTSFLVVVALVAAGGGAWWVVRQARRGDGVGLDERDHAILERARAVQSPATILTLGLWTIVLTERFWVAADVPVIYLQLVFWSCVLINLLALPAGVLVGYRKG